MDLEKLGQAGIHAHNQTTSKRTLDLVKLFFPFGLGVYVASLEINWPIPFVACERDFSLVKKTPSLDNRNPFHICSC